MPPTNGVPQQREFTRAGESVEPGDEVGRTDRRPTDRQSPAGHQPPAGQRPTSRDAGARLERLGEKTEDFVDSVESGIGKAVPKRVHARRHPRQNTVINVTWRALVLLAGLTMIAVGVVLLVLPGPGWASILLGLVILATEYTWANRLLAPVRRRVRAEAARLERFSPRQQLAIKAATLAFTIMSVAFGIWYLVQYGWTLPW